PARSTLLPYTTLFRSSLPWTGWGPAASIGPYLSERPALVKKQPPACAASNHAGRRDLSDSRPVRAAGADSARSRPWANGRARCRSEEHTSELQSRENL